MKKNFFLEGPIQEGKSTVIRKLIRDYLPHIGGFSSQRLLDDSGKKVGFRLVPAAEAMVLTSEYSPELSDVFLYFGNEKTKITPQVFTEAAVRFLQNKEGKKLMLLDEIGGIELLDPDFRKGLYEILEGDIPCMGVLKLESGVRDMCRNTAINEACIGYHMKLRSDMISRFDADIVRYERKHAKQTEQAIKEFLDPIFE